MLQRQLKDKFLFLLKIFLTFSSKLQISDISTTSRFNFLVIDILPLAKYKAEKWLLVCVIYYLRPYMQFPYALRQDNPKFAQGTSMINISFHFYAFLNRK